MHAHIALFLFAAAIGLGVGAYFAVRADEIVSLKNQSDCEDPLKWSGTCGGSDCCGNWKDGMCWKGSLTGPKSNLKCTTKGNFLPLVLLIGAGVAVLGMLAALFWPSSAKHEEYMGGGNY